MTEILEPAFRFGADEPSKGTWRKVTFGDMAQCVTDRVDNPAEAGVDRYVGLEHLDPVGRSVRRGKHETAVSAGRYYFRQAPRLPEKVSGCGFRGHLFRARDGVAGAGRNGIEGISARLHAVRYFL